MRSTPRATAEHKRSPRKTKPKAFKSLSKGTRTPVSPKLSKSTWRYQPQAPSNNRLSLSSPGGTVNLRSRLDPRVFSFIDTRRIGLWLSQNVAHHHRQITYRSLPITTV